MDKDHDFDLSSWDIAIEGGAVFGLEMQHPWSQHLLQGRKTIEVRNYELPPALVGRKIYIIESRPGRDGISVLGDSIELPDKDTSSSSSGDSSPLIAGWCIFDSIRIYTSQTAFEADEKQHLVSSTSGYAWQSGTTILYGWIVKDYHNHSDINSSTNETPSFCVAERRQRSIFELKKAELP